MAKAYAAAHQPSHMEKSLHFTVHRTNTSLAQMSSQPSDPSNVTVQPNTTLHLSQSHSFLHFRQCLGQQHNNMQQSALPHCGLSGYSTCCIHHLYIKHSAGPSSRQPHTSKQSLASWPLSVAHTMKQKLTHTQVSRSLLHTLPASRSHEPHHLAWLPLSWAAQTPLCAHLPSHFSRAWHTFQKVIFTHKSRK